MKHTMVFILAAGPALLLAGTSPQQGSHHKGIDQEKHMQLMEMMEDSSMVDMMMDHIVADHGMRMSMMHKMMSHAKADSSSMMEMCRTMMNDSDMHSCMMKMMDGGMMDHDTMRGKTPDSQDQHPKDH